MPTQARHIHREVVDKTKANAHLIMGYVFLGLVFMGAISSVYYWEYKARVNAAERQMAIPKHVESGEALDVNGASCVNEPTWALQRQTGEKRQFPTACHIDTERWEIVAN